jgi:hypothetical protein
VAGRKRLVKSSGIITGLTNVALDTQPVQQPKWSGLSGQRGLHGGAYGGGQGRPKEVAYEGTNGGTNGGAHGGSQWPGQHPEVLQAETQKPQTPTLGPAIGNSSQQATTGFYYQSQPRQNSDVHG